MCTAALPATSPALPPSPSLCLAPGYRVFAADSDLASCSLLNPFSRCDSTAGKVVAVETDGSCAVRLFVLGDSQCSQVEDLAVVQG